MVGFNKKQVAKKEVKITKIGANFYINFSLITKILVNADLSQLHNM